MTLHERLLLFGGRLPAALSESFRCAYLRTIPRAGDGGDRLAVERLTEEEVLFRAAGGAEVCFRQQLHDLTP